LLLIRLITDFKTAIMVPIPPKASGSGLQPSRRPKLKIKPKSKLRLIEAPGIGKKHKKSGRKGRNKGGSSRRTDFGSTPVAGAAGDKVQIVPWSSR
jgi:hypothetical protein